MNQSDSRIERAAAVLDSYAESDEPSYLVAQKMLEAAGHSDARILVVVPRALDTQSTDVVVFAGSKRLGLHGRPVTNHDGDWVMTFDEEAATPGHSCPRCRSEARGWR